jgi:hypothetical protein
MKAITIAIGLIKITACAIISLIMSYLSSQPCFPTLFLHSLLGAIIMDLGDLKEKGEKND